MMDVVFPALQLERCMRGWLGSFRHACPLLETGLFPHLLRFHGSLAVEVDGKVLPRFPTLKCGGTPQSCRPISRIDDIINFDFPRKIVSIKKPGCDYVAFNLQGLS